MNSCNACDNGTKHCSLGVFNNVNHVIYATIGITYVPVTTQYRQSAYEVVLPKLRFLDQDSVANLQGLGSIPKVRLERRLGKLSDDVMKEIKNAISFALDLEVEVPKPTSKK